VRKDRWSLALNMFIEMDAIANFREDVLKPHLSIDQLVNCNLHPVEFEQVKGA
jgi:hypothetical protein